MIEIFARKGLSRRIYQLVPPKYQMFKIYGATCIYSDLTAWIMSDYRE